jgi:hypothetical protein
MEAGPIKVAGEAVDGLLDTKVAGYWDVVGFLKKGGAEGWRDVEAVVRVGVEKAVADDEAGVLARPSPTEGRLVSGIGGRFRANLVEEGGGDGEGGAYGMKDQREGGRRIGVAGESVGDDVGGAGFVDDVNIELGEELKPVSLPL